MTFCTVCFGQWNHLAPPLRYPSSNRAGTRDAVKLLFCSVSNSRKSTFLCFGS